MTIPPTVPSSFPFLGYSSSVSRKSITSLASALLNFLFISPNRPSVIITLAILFIQPCSCFFKSYGVLLVHEQVTDLPLFRALQKPCNDFFISLPLGSEFF